VSGSGGAEDVAGVDGDAPSTSLRTGSGDEAVHLVRGVENAVVVGRRGVLARDASTGVELLSPLAGLGSVRGGLTHGLSRGL
jgi:hypothetical protein